MSPILLRWERKQEDRKAQGKNHPKIFGHYQKFEAMFGKFFVGLSFYRKALNFLEALQNPGIIS